MVIMEAHKLGPQNPKGGDFVGSIITIIIVVSTMWFLWEVKYGPEYYGISDPSFTFCAYKIPKKYSSVSAHKVTSVGGLFMDDQNSDLNIASVKESSLRARSLSLYRAAEWLAVGVLISLAAMFFFSGAR
jgi:hypothetical protein